MNSDRNMTNGNPFYSLQDDEDDSLIPSIQDIDKTGRLAKKLDKLAVRMGELTLEPNKSSTNFVSKKKHEPKDLEFLEHELSLIIEDISNLSVTKTGKAKLKVSVMKGLKNSFKKLCISKKPIMSPTKVHTILHYLKEREEVLLAKAISVFHTGSCRMAAHLTQTEMFKAIQDGSYASRRRRNHRHSSDSEEERNQSGSEREHD